MIMKIDKVLALVLPGLRGSIGIGLNNQQLWSLLKGLLNENVPLISSVYL